MWLIAAFSSTVWGLEPESAAAGDPERDGAETEEGEGTGERGGGGCRR